MSRYLGDVSFFDICQAHMQLESDYNCGGIVIERPRNARRNESTGCQLHRLNFNPGARWVDVLAEDDPDGDEDSTVRDIYLENVVKWGLPVDDEMRAAIERRFVADWLASHNFPNRHTKG